MKKVFNVLFLERKERKVQDCRTLYGALWQRCSFVARPVVGRPSESGYSDTHGILVLEMENLTILS
jgi:hypothetical protein